MNPRRLCNVVYAHLVAGADEESRAKFDADLNTPVADGWAEVQRRVFRMLADEEE